MVIPPQATPPANGVPPTPCPSANRTSTPRSGRAATSCAAEWTRPKYKDYVLKGTKDIGDRINKVIGRLADANDHLLKGVTVP